MLYIDWWILIYVVLNHMLKTSELQILIERLKICVNSIPFERVIWWVGLDWHHEAHIMVSSCIIFLDDFINSGYYISNYM